MSMSQEEIESLMNGLDIEEDSSSSEPTAEETNTGTMSEDDINNLIAETEEIVSSTDDDVNNEESVDELLNGLEELSNEEQKPDDANIDDIIKELDTNDSTPEAVENNEAVSNENIDELLASIDGVQDNEPVKEEQVEASSELDIDSLASEIASSDNSVSDTQAAVVSSDDEDIEDIDHKINSGVFPLPVEEDTKVVNQLNAVANDSEEKASKIFDVLSNILDYNTNIQNDVQQLAQFNQQQIAMLSSLSSKFPNIEAFKQNLNQAQSMGAHIQDVNEKIDIGNTEIFQAMELMQYHDINRQKIERVMSVIRKLSTYLNNLFEDEENRPEVAVAKHIHGDNTTDLVGDDDLEALIAEFNN